MKGSQGLDKTITHQCRQGKRSHTDKRNTHTKIREEKFVNGSGMPGFTGQLIFRLTRKPLTSRPTLKGEKSTRNDLSIWLKHENDGALSRSRSDLKRG